MTEALIESLPLPQRLALSYASRSAKPAILGLFVLEQKLASIIAMGGEPMIAQIKLAWWRERMAEPRANWPTGEPLLDHLRNTDPDLALDRWTQLVDGYETFLAENFGKGELAAFLDGKAAAWLSVMDACEVDRDRAACRQAAHEVALFDLGGRLTDPNEVDIVVQADRQRDWQAVALPRDLRPLSVLHALARRARANESNGLLEGGGAMALAMRVGLFGR